MDFNVWLQQLILSKYSITYFWTVVITKFRPRSQSSGPSGLLSPLRPLKVQIADLGQATQARLYEAVMRYYLELQYTHSTQINMVCFEHVDSETCIVLPYVLFYL